MKAQPNRFGDSNFILFYVIRWDSRENLYLFWSSSALFDDDGSYNIIVSHHFPSFFSFWYSMCRHFVCCVLGGRESSWINLWHVLWHFNFDMEKFLSQRSYNEPALSKDSNNPSIVNSEALFPHNTHPICDNKLCVQKIESDRVWLRVAELRPTNFFYWI